MTYHPAQPIRHGTATESYTADEGSPLPVAGSFDEEILKQLKKMNMYLALLLGKEIRDGDINV